MKSFRYCMRLKFITDQMANSIVSFWIYLKILRTPSNSTIESIVSFEEKIN